MANLTDEHKKDIEAIAPGVYSAYEGLKKDNPYGFYTSMGRFYNHTIFGRDLAQSARFVVDFDPDTARKAIRTLAELQGTKYDRVTQEAPGRIHHEFRDFSTYRGGYSERFLFWWLRKVWGSSKNQILTYFSVDSAPLYIRLLHRYVKNIDPNILNTTYTDRDGMRSTIGESVARAAEWIMSCVDGNGRFMTMRTNRWSLPYQTIEDGVTAYAWKDKRAANCNDPISFTEIQAFAIDALEDAAGMLKDERAKNWLDVAARMRNALMFHYWDATDDFLTSALTYRDGVLKHMDVPNISAGWTLNNTFWKELPKHEHKERVTAIVERLFSDEFLTEVGLRTRSKYFEEPLGNSIVDYHGSQTVWTMFNFMVIEGLQRQHMYELADQLSRRLLNAANAIPDFQEYYIVDKKGTFKTPSGAHHAPVQRVQMLPEKDIAFTIVPLIMLAFRRVTPKDRHEPLAWQKELEEAILSRIPLVDLLHPEEARQELNPTPVQLSRKAGWIWSFEYLQEPKVR